MSSPLPPLATQRRRAMSAATTTPMAIISP
jgi:hypothetical protein